MFRYTITNGACTSNNHAIAYILEAPVLSATSTPTTCGSNTGSIDLIIDGDDNTQTFLWSNGATTEDLTNVEGGSYTVTVTDDGGCSATYTIGVDNTDGPGATFTANPDPSCAGEEVTLTASGTGGSGGPYSYLWEDGAGTTSPSTTVTPVSDTIIYVVVSDGSSCENRVGVSVDVRERPALNLGADITVCGGTDVTLTANILANTTYSGATTSSFPYSNTLDADLGDWTQSSDDDFDWSHSSSSTFTSNTGPSSPANGSSGYYYTEATTNSNSSAILLSPVYDLTAAATAQFDFYYHMYGAEMGSLTLEISDDDGISWTSLWSLSGDQGNSWQTQSVSLDAYAGDYVQLRFVGDIGFSPGYLSDMAIDELSLTTTSISYSWSTGETTASITVNPPLTTTYTVTANHANGCALIDSISVRGYCEFDLGDYVWVDTDGDGIQDGSESGLNGVTVNLYEDFDNNGSPDGAAISTTTTANNGSDGYYEFLNVPTHETGDYIIEFIEPAGYAITVQDVSGGTEAADSDADPSTGYAITSGVQLDNFDIDAGMYQPANIGDYVWVDSDQNGIQNEVSTGLSGVIVHVYQDSDTDGIPDGGVIATDVSDGNGAYSFSTLAPGSYVLEFEVSGYDFSAKDQTTEANDSDVFPTTGYTSTVTLTSGETNNDIDAGVYQAGNIGNWVWIDNNVDGIQNNAETGMDGVTVNLYNDIGLDGTPDGAAIASTVTAGGGYYTFYGLSAGDYIVEFEIPVGHLVTTQDAGSSTEATDSDADPSTGLSHSFSLSVGSDNFDVDMGLYQQATIGELVWHDIDGDGIQDGGEPGIDNVLVSLYPDDDQDGIPDGPAEQTVLTSGGGGWGMLINPGFYVISFSTPPSYSFSYQDQGSDDAADSDVDPGTGYTDVLTIISGSTDNFIDAGLHQPVTIGNLIWEDLNQNGIQDDGATGIDGITVFLYRDSDTDGSPDGTAIDTTTTASGGGYQFSDIPPGSYILEVDVPYYMDVAPQDDGSATEATDSDINISTGRTATFFMADGQTNNDIDAGLNQPTGFGGRLWSDADVDGFQDVEETGLAGTTIYLYDASGNMVKSVPISTYIDSLTLTSTYAGTNGSLDWSANPWQDSDPDGPNSGEVQITTDGSTNAITITNQGETIERDINLSDYDSAKVQFEYRRVNLDLGEHIDLEYYDGSSWVYLTEFNSTANNTTDGSYLTIGPLALPSVATKIRFHAVDMAVNATVYIDNIQISCYDSHPDSTITDSEGNYLFTIDNHSFTPGNNYQLRLSPSTSLSDYKLTIQNAGGDTSDNYATDIDDSDAESISNPGFWTISLSAPSTGTNASFDFGAYETASIGNLVWEDSDGDGIQDSGESGINSVTVNLYADADEDGNPDGASIASTTTVNGAYSFTGLDPGGYLIEVVNPGSYYFSPQDNSNASEASDSDVHSSTGLSSTIILSAGQINNNIDAGLTSSLVFPVEWLGFSVEKTGRDAELNWQTGQEINVNYFDIERSIDQVSFEIIGRLPSNKSGNSDNSYNFIDKGIVDLGSPLIFYRLKNVDLNGNYGYSSVRELQIIPEDLVSVIIYPNPGDEILNVKYILRTNNQNYSDKQLVVFNTLGYKMYQQNISWNQLNGYIQIDASQWAEGIYYVSLLSNGFSETVKFTKK